MLWRWLHLLVASLGSVLVFMCVMAFVNQGTELPARPAPVNAAGVALFMLFFLIVSVASALRAYWVNNEV